MKQSNFALSVISLACALCSPSISAEGGGDLADIETNNNFRQK